MRALLAGAVLLAASVAHAQAPVIGPLQAQNALRELTLNAATARQNIGADSLQKSVSAAVTAAGTTQGTATLLTAQINVVGSAVAGTGVLLTAGLTGAPVTVINRSVNTVSVYPPVGAQIEAAGTNAPVPIYPGGAANFVTVSTNQWSAW